MSALLQKLKAFKEYAEPVIWLIVSVLAPAGAGILLAWSLFISPRIEEYFKSLTAGISAELQKHTNMLEIVKHKISDEVDSTYYFTKRYSIATSPEKEQEPLSQFFYVGPDDKVSLFIWYSGRKRMKMLVSINDGPKKSLADFPDHPPTWTNIDITTLVKSSETLNDEMYAGISEDVYNISITPIPNRLPDKRPLPSRADTKKPDTPGEDLDLTDVHALVVVRRSPFK